MAKQRFTTKDYEKSRRVQRLALWAIGIVALAITLITFPNFIRSLTETLGPEVRKQPEYGIAMFWAFLCSIELASLLFVPIWAGYYGWHKGRGTVYRKNATYADIQGITYYRDFLKGVSPALMSILMDMRIEDRKDVSATLLRMYDRKIIGFEGERIVCYQHSERLGADEQELFDMILSGGITANGALEWKKNRLRDAIENGYIKSDSRGRDDFNQKGCQLGCLGMFVLFVAFGVLMIALSGGLTAFTEEENDNLDKALDVYGSYFMSIFEPLDNLMNTLEDKMVLVDPSYTRSDDTELPTLDAVESLSALVAILWRSAVFFGAFMIVVGYPVFIFLYFCGYDSVKMKTQFARTEKGNDLAEKIAGLQRFIRDFSNLSESQKEEVLLWNDFLVYAVVLEENALIPHDVVSRFQRYLSGLYYSETSHAANFHMQFDATRDRNDVVKQPWKKK